MKKALLVDDDLSLLTLYQKRLQLGGFNVLIAHNGEEGLEIALSEHPDLILLDIEMPKMDGMTMMKKIRQDAWGENTPIIMLTNADTDDKKLQQINEYLPAYYLIKDSLTPDEVLDKVNEILG